MEQEGMPRDRLSYPCCSTGEEDAHDALGISISDAVLNFLFKLFPSIFIIFNTFNQQCPRHWSATLAKDCVLNENGPAG